MGSEHGHRCGCWRVHVAAARSTTVAQLSVAILSMCLLATPLTPALAAATPPPAKSSIEPAASAATATAAPRPPLGPSLVGIIGRKAGTGESGVHSRAMTESGIRWDEALLRKFLAAPTKQVPGTIMPGAVQDAQEIDDLIAFLETLR